MYIHVYILFWIISQKSVAEYFDPTEDAVEDGETCVLLMCC